jgi:putative membrane protein
MTLRIVLAALHLLALGLGLYAVISRGTSLRERPVSAGSLRRAFRADAVWGLSALLWISTGLWRLFGETEKTTSYYMLNHVFYAKMGLLLLVLLLEIWPMVALIRARVSLGRGASPDIAVTPGTARRIATISHLQALLVVAMVFAAVAMARGVGMRTPG